MKAWVLAGLAAVLFAVAGGAPAASTPASAESLAGSSKPAAATLVRVVLKEWSIKAPSKAVPAGKVTFVVRNAGKMKHEFLVIRSEKHHHLLSMKGKRASEAGEQGEIERIAPKATKRLTLTLAPGKYVLLCNLPGHYKKGQYASFVVKGAAPVTTNQATNVSVSAFEMGFKLSQTTVPVGTVTFTVKNDGKAPHDFTFGEKNGGGTRMLQAGESDTLTVKFTKPGKYTFWCTVEGHMEAGMIGQLTVK